MELIAATSPKSILDIGFGNGKYAFLAREYLEIWNGFLKREDWERRIDGIEVFEDYITPLHYALFDNIYIGDATEVLPGLNVSYELILLIDVLEHFGYEEGMELLEACTKKGRNVIISTPKDIGVQGELYGNPFEAHRFQWTKKQFSVFKSKFFVPNCFSYICFIGDDAPRVKERCRALNLRAALSDFKEYFPRFAEAWTAIRRRIVRPPGNGS